VRETWGREEDDDGLVVRWSQKYCIVLESCKTLTRGRHATVDCPSPARPERASCLTPSPSATHRL